MKIERIKGQRRRVVGTDTHRLSGLFVEETSMPLIDHSVEALRLHVAGSDFVVEVEPIRPRELTGKIRCPNNRIIQGRRLKIEGFCS
jgi:hypothetical protein